MYFLEIQMSLAVGIALVFHFIFSYVSTVTRDFSSEEDSAILRMMQAVAVPILGNVCHVFMNGLNRVQV